MMAARILLVAAATMAEEGFRLHRGPRHAALYGEYRAARRRCDARDCREALEAKRERFGNDTVRRRELRFAQSVHKQETLRDPV